MGGHAIVGIRARGGFIFQTMKHVQMFAILNQSAHQPCRQVVVLSLFPSVLLFQFQTSVSRHHDSVPNDLAVLVIKRVHKYGFYCVARYATFLRFGVNMLRNLRSCKDEMWNFARGKAE